MQQERLVGSRTLYRNGTVWRGTVTPFIAIASLLGILAAPPLEAQQGRAREPRIAPLESAEGINIMRTLANHPALAEAWLPFAGYILGQNSLPPHDRELLILRIAYLCGADYEWGHHTRMAKEAGVTEAEIQQVLKGPNAEGWGSFGRALMRAADELHRDATISDRTWAYLDARYDEKQLMDVVFTVGQYNMVSMALNSFRVPMDEGLEGIPK